MSLQNETDPYDTEEDEPTYDKLWVPPSEKEEFVIIDPDTGLPVDVTVPLTEAEIVEILKKL